MFTLLVNTGAVANLELSFKIFLLGSVDVSRHKMKICLLDIVILGDKDITKIS